MLLSCMSLEGIFFLKGGVLKAFVETLLEGRNKERFFSGHLLCCFHADLPTLGILRLVVRWCSRIGTCPFHSTQSSPAFGDLCAPGLCLCRINFVAGTVWPLEKVLLRSSVILGFKYLAHHLQNFCSFRCADSAWITFYR